MRCGDLHSEMMDKNDDDFIPRKRSKDRFPKGGSKKPLPQEVLRTNCNSRRRDQKLFKRRNQLYNFH